MKRVYECKKCKTTSEVVSFDYDNKAIEILRGDVVLGTIYPSNTVDTDQCIRDLEAGDCPVCGSWADGRGNTVSLEGWQ